MECELVGDAGGTLRVPLPRLHEREERGFLDGIQAEVGKWRSRLKEQGELADTPMKPQIVRNIASEAIRELV